MSLCSGDPRAHGTGEDITQELHMEFPCLKSFTTDIHMLTPLE